MAYTTTLKNFHKRLNSLILFQKVHQLDSLFGTGVMLLTLQLMGGGYQFGYGEQVILSLKGLDWIDRTNWQNDWFVHNAPQPHVFFDFVTFLGNSVSALPVIYFIYYLISLYLFALATSVLWRKLPLDFLKKSPSYSQHIINIFAVIGPSFVLGTYLTITNQALPNMLGGAFSYLIISLLLVNKTDLIGLLALATSIVHIQHGIAICLIVIFTSLWTQPKYERWENIVFSTIGVLWAICVGIWRRTFLGGEEIANDISNSGSVSHFNVQSWSFVQLIVGILLLFFSMYFLLLIGKVSGSKIPKVTSLILLLMAFAIVISITSDMMNFENINSIFRSLFIYRFSMYLLPFVYWSWAYLFLTPRKTYISKAVALLFSTFLLALIFCFPAETQSKVSIFNGLVLVTTFGLIYVIRLTIDVNKVKLLLSTGIIAFSVSLISMSISPKVFELGYSNDDVLQQIGTSINLALGPEEVLASDPELNWLRLASRTSLVADCKGVPYGGQAWYEYKRRLSYLGVNNPSKCKGFHELSPNQIKNIRSGVGATSILLTPDDKSYIWAEKNLEIIWQSSPSGDSWKIFRLP